MKIFKSRKGSTYIKTSEGKNDVMKPFKRYASFTLAEVLITLSILGIVAAVTVPSIVRNYQKKITVTKL